MLTQIAQKSRPGRRSEQRAAWEILRDSPTVRALAVLAGPYWPHPTAAQVTRPSSGKLADRQVLLAEATRYHNPANPDCAHERREALLDDALDDSFPASDRPRSPCSGIAIAGPDPGLALSDGRLARRSSPQSPTNRRKRNDQIVRK